MPAKIELIKNSLPEKLISSAKTDSYRTVLVYVVGLIYAKSYGGDVLFEYIISIFNNVSQNL